LAVTGDWHLNDTKALCPPVFRKEDGEYRASDFQLAIWSAWCEYWELVEDWKAKLSARIISVACGDLADANKHSKAQLISPLKADIQRGLQDVIKPAEGIADYHVIVRGTEAHTGACGELEEEFANDLTSAVHDDWGGTASWWVWKAKLEGVIIQASHKPPTSTRLPGKRGQAVSRMCERLADEYDGKPDRPDLAFWAHVHWSAPGYDKGIHGWTVPSWKGIGQFGYHLAVTKPSPVGGLIVILPGLDGSRWTIKRFLRTPPTAPIWTLDCLEPSTSAPKSLLQRLPRPFRSRSNPER
jgi:hypothetical protein